jgi:hypothetical protein
MQKKVNFAILAAKMQTVESLTEPPEKKMNCLEQCFNQALQQQISA